VKTPPEMTLIANAEVLAPEPYGRRFLLLGGGRILWMGEDRPSMPASLEVEVVDLEGRRLVPGFIDGHAHVTGGGGEAGYGSSVAPLGAEVFLSAGVTTVVGLLGTDDCVRTTAQLVHASYGLRAQGMSAWCYTGGYHLPPMTLTGSVKQDIIHLDPVLGFGELAISDHRSSQPTLSEFLRLASECHVAGLMSGKAGTLHLHLGDGDRGLDLVRRALAEAEIPARTYHPTHVNRRAPLFGESLEIARRGVYIDVTASPEPADRARFDEEREGDELFPLEAVEAILAQGDIDEHWTLSSDGGGCLPVFDEQGQISHLDVGRPDTLPTLFFRMLELGADPTRVLRGMTSNWASLLRLANKGRIAVGMDADLLALDDTSLYRVWCGGRARDL
jgi:beta-aspartyl-dipeptidase (metallo-type)